MSKSHRNASQIVADVLITSAAALYLIHALCSSRPQPLIVEGCMQANNACWCVSAFVHWMAIKPDALQARPEL